MFFGGNNYNSYNTPVLARGRAVVTDKNAITTITTKFVTTNICLLICCNCCNGDFSDYNTARLDISRVVVIVVIVSKESYNILFFSKKYPHQLARVVD